MPAIRRLSLDRRAFLRGAGACVALPWLDAMAPALAAPPKPRPRAMFVFAPNGVCLDRWRPHGEGRDAKLGATMAGLEPLRSRVTVFTGFAIDGGRPHADGVGDHARAAASFLTCAHPRKTGGADIQAGVSIDQAIAQRLAEDCAFPSLEVGMEPGQSAGVCDSGYSCAYTNNISWRAPDAPVAKETDPRAVFARLFGDPAQAIDREARQRDRAWERSVLDLVQADAKALRQKLGAGDRNKLDQYLDALRDLEQRLAQPEPDEGPDVPVPDGLLGAKRLPERIALMYEVVALALATGRTRVVSMMLGNGGSRLSYGFLGAPGAHHDLSHHGKLPEKLDMLAKIDRFQVDQLAAFLQRLAATQEGDGDLLASTFVVYGSGLGDGNRHNHDDLPVLLAGEGGGAAQGRGHVRFAHETPMANLYLAILRAMGGVDERFADSTEPLALR